MKISTIKSMLSVAKKNGHAEIVYNGMSSGGLYSSSSCRVPIFLTRYPDVSTESSANFHECLKSVGKQLEDFLDTVEVHDGFIEVIINHLAYVDSNLTDIDKNDAHITADELYCTYKSKKYTVNCIYHRGSVASSNYSYDHKWIDKGGEPFHRILIPFENIIAIVC